MIDVNILQCIFVTTAAIYAIKVAAGVSCNKDLNSVYTAYNYLLIGDSHINHGCDITPQILCNVLAHQNAKSLTIQTCC